MRLFAGYIHSILDGEMDIHRAYMTRLGIAKEEAEQTPVALLIICPIPLICFVSLYEEGEAEVMAAILSCALSYEFIAKKILAEYPAADKHEFYGEWVSGYASDSYHEDNEVLADLMNRLTEDYSEAETASRGHLYSMLPLRGGILGYGMGNEAVGC